MEQESERMTNFERIKAMSVEELSRFIISTAWVCRYCDPEKECGWDDDCSLCSKEWLESEVQDEEEN